MGKHLLLSWLKARRQGQVGFPFGEGVPGRDRRAKAVLVEKQDLPPGRSERSVSVLLGPNNNSPFAIKPASRCCLEDWGGGGLSPPQTRQPVPEAVRSLKGKRTATFPSFRLDSLLVQGRPCLFRDARHPTI